ncbi:AMP-binding protein [Williamsia phyllosphaerae]|uniref:Acyl-CoA synthetase n=1 Tax=Williamsia phyllosphaerae TaxID=885042 RepID=A0ABQ1USA2_9NOCA|nr:AMP-binding protein [Williamsia phyllosphaerae]GGF23995.1 acyl-CoA synthetase [Williamsia phyllosphaerae]
MAQNLADLFEHAVDAVPDRVAVVDGESGTEFTYTELEDRSNRVAHLLIDHGVRGGSHVAIHMHNAVDTLAGFLAAFKLRAVPVNVNYRYVRDELVYVYDDADVVAVLTQPRYADAARAATEHPVIVVDERFEETLAGCSSERDFEARADDDLFLMYTGGTTGAPKGVMWRQADMWRVLGGGIDFYSGELMADEYAQSARAGESADPMRFLMLPPLIHVSGLMPTLGALFSGNTVIFEPRFDAGRVWEVVETCRPAIMVITGDAMGRPLIDELEGRVAAGRAVDVSSLLAVSSGAALFSPALKARLLGLAPTVAISDSIGSSETGFGGIRVYSAADTSFATADHAGGPRVPAGRGATVIDDDGAPLTGPGEGWFAKTGYLPIGYYKDEAKSATIFREHEGVRMVVSGDRARREPDGAITLLGRGSQVVNTGGEKVFVEEVEGELKSHPAVVDAIVIAVADERFGQGVAAVVAVTGVPDFEAIEAHLRTRLAGYKVPRTYWVVDAVTRTPSGKPDYGWAKSIAASSDPAHVRDAARSHL